MGDDFTLESIRRLSKAPEEHILHFVHDLVEPYTTNDPEDISTELNNKSYQYCIIPPSDRSDFQKLSNSYKALLLYFDKIMVPDPLSDFLAPTIMYAQLTGELRLGYKQLDQFRDSFQKALEFLLGFKKPITQGAIEIFPETFLTLSSVVQTRARLELNEILGNTPKDKSYHENPLNLIREEVLNWGHLIEILDVMPISSNRDVKNIMTEELRLDKHLKSTSRQSLIAEASFSYEIPGIQNPTIDDIISLRKNENAFNEWRSEYSSIINETLGRSQISSNAEFQKEFKYNTDERLKPIVSKLNEKTNSNKVITDLLIPGGLAIGGSMLTYEVTNSLIATLLPTATVPVSWALKRIAGKLGKENRKDITLRDFCGHFIQ